MGVTLAQLARRVEAELVGDAGLVISGAATLRDATRCDITLADRPQLADELAESQAAAVVVPRSWRPVANRALLVVEDVHAAFVEIVRVFRPACARPDPGVHPAACVSPTAKLGSGVHVGPQASVGPGVELEDGVVVHAGAHLLGQCRVGRDSEIFPGAVLYEGTIVGARCRIHANAVLGAYGFGYDSRQGRHQLSAQLGYVELGDDVEIGAGSTVDRGTYGPTTIGDGTKLDNLVMIAHNCRIGRHNLICAQVGIAGSSTTGDYVVLAGQVGVRDHLHIGDGARLGAQAGARTDIPAGASYFGTPALPEKEAFAIMAGQRRLKEMRRHLKQIQRWIDEQTGSPTVQPDDERDAA